MTQEVSVADIRSCSNDAERALLFNEMYFKIVNPTIDFLAELLTQIEDQKARNLVFYKSIENLLCDFGSEEVNQIGSAIGIEDKINFTPSI